MKKLVLKRIAVTVAALLVVVAIGLLLRVAYLRSPEHKTTLVYSNNAELYELWSTYKFDNLDPATHRTIDKTQNNITTSEGEGYTMMRATWVDDQTTFDQNWDWTQANLQRPDKLFSWKYGSLGNGKYGIQTSVGGNNTAADGDTNIALSLLMAYSRWGNTKYLTAAEQIIPHIWQDEVLNINSKPVLVADDLERNKLGDVVINPSYFEPYAYKTFAKVDLTHDWTALASNSYSVLDALSDAQLGSSDPVGLEPDWAVIDRSSGTLNAAPAVNTNLDTNYGFDAMRVVWNLALDYQWFNDPRDVAVLNDFSFLKTQFQKTGSIQSIYSRSGSVIGNYETPAAYGTAVAYFDVVDPTDAATLYKTKLQTLYDPDTQTWHEKSKYAELDYYDDNWAWFGIALTQHALPNLTEHTK